MRHKCQFKKCITPNIVINAFAFARHSLWGQQQELIKLSCSVHWKWMLETLLWKPWRGRMSWASTLWVWRRTDWQLHISRLKAISRMSSSEFLKESTVPPEVFLVLLLISFHQPLFATHPSCKIQSIVLQLCPQYNSKPQTWVLNSNQYFTPFVKTESSWLQIKFDMQGLCSGKEARHEAK